MYEFVGFPPVQGGVSTCWGHGGGHKNFTGKMLFHGHQNWLRVKKNRAVMPIPILFLRFVKYVVCGLLPLLCDVLNASCLFVLKLAKGIVSVLLSLAGLPLYVVIGLFSCVVIGLFSCVVIDCLSPFCDWLPFPVL